MSHPGFDTDPERALALSYAAPDKRAALAALLAFDDALASLLRTTTEPAVAQIRLAWWREQVAALGKSVVPAMPVLEGLARHVVPQGVDPLRLVGIVEGWEVLVEAERMDDTALSGFAAKRGGGVFSIGGDLLGGPVSAAAGQGWALADLAQHLSMGAEAAQARDMARTLLTTRWPWPRETRSLGALATIARMDLALPDHAPVPLASPRRVARLAWMRLTGR